ncbi:MAG: GntR family transcriptional regulator [Oscillospiraceae bacterium]|nr:GntR family transcriptional regulator [Oscillospiraceae bacterium]
MQWHLDNELPIYTQLVGHIKRAIATGELRPGEKMTPVRELSLEAGVNPNTMQRALQQLEREGLVYPQRGNGRYVTEDVDVIDRARKALAAGHVRRYREAMRALGYSEEEMAALLRENREEENNGSMS